MADIIVYSQTELDSAVRDGISFITLCAGIFVLPCASNTVFDRIGPVKVKVQCTRREAEAAGMVFRDIYPEYKPEYAVDFKALMQPVAAVSSGSYGSVGSYNSSFSVTFNALSSLAGSFRGSGYIFGYGIDLI